MVLLHSVSYFFYLCPSPSSSLFTIFYSISISFNIDEVSSINPFANVFVFGGFNINHKDQLLCHQESRITIIIQKFTVKIDTLSDRSSELCHNFSIPSDLTQMVNFPTCSPDCDFSFGFISFLTLEFVLQWLYLYCEILIMLLPQFPLTFYHIHNGIPQFIAWLITILVLI